MLQVSSTDNTKEFITSLENKITCIKNMFQNKCEVSQNEISIILIVYNNLIQIFIFTDVHQRKFTVGNSRNYFQSHVGNTGFI